MQFFLCSKLAVKDSHMLATYQKLLTFQWEIKSARSLMTTYIDIYSITSMLFM